MNSDISESESELHYGGFWRRGFAFLIDLLIVKCLVLILFVAGILAARKGLNDLEITAPSEDLVVLLTGLFILTGMISLFLYFFYFNYQGQSPGMNLAGVRIISQNREPIRLIQALVRSFGMGLSTLFFFLGFFLSLFSRKKVTLHDAMAGTYVIRC
jgi:uncharacterized RDD family membrane protein YckC